MEKKFYQQPCLKEISFSTEQVLDVSFPELPDHDWVQESGIQVFSDEP